MLLLFDFLLLLLLLLQACVDTTDKDTLTVYKKNVFCSFFSIAKMVRLRSVDNKKNYIIIILILLRYMNFLLFVFASTSLTLPSHSLCIYFDCFDRFTPKLFALWEVLRLWSNTKALRFSNLTRQASVSGECSCIVSLICMCAHFSSFGVHRQRLYIIKMFI